MIVWAFDFILGATLLMLLVLAVRKPVAQLFGAEWAYALWMLPVLVPFLPELPSLHPGPAFTVLLPPVDGGATAVSASAQAAGAGGEWLLLLLALWGGGAAVFAIWQQSTYSAFMLHLGPRGRTAVPPSYGGVKVVESDAVEGPVALGIFNRRIVVPLDFATRYTAAEQRLALEHELVHHRRLDLVWNWAALGMLTLNWFNPIAHIAFRAFRADQELACDAAVTRSAPDQRHDYACALVKSASHPGLIAVCPLNHADFLKRRLRMMKQHRASWARTIGGAASIGLFAVAGLALAAPGFAQREQSGQVVVNEPRQDPIISKADVARLREKCGRDEDAGSASIVCSEEEASDPEVKAIMSRTMKRVERKVDEALDAAKIEEKVAKAASASASAAARIDVRREEAVERAAEAAATERVVKLHGPEHRERMREAVRRAHEQIARAHIPDHEAEISRALAVAQTQLASIDVDAITRDAIRSAQKSLRAVRVHLSPEERAELHREIAEARAEAHAEAAADRSEALREIEEARREARREAREARRELQREMRELERELGELPAPPVPPRSFRTPTPPAPPATPVR